MVLAPSSGRAAGARRVLALGSERREDTFDLTVRLDSRARQSDGFLRGEPRSRPAAIHSAFRDPEVAAVIATLGGDDQLHVLRHLRPDVLRNHPTRFFGMSDTTNLGLFLRSLGVVSFSGGQLLNQVATSGGRDECSEGYLRRVLFHDSLGELQPAGAWADPTVGWHVDGYAERDLESPDHRG